MPGIVFLILAELTLLLHLAFILFVAGGGLLAWRRPRLAPWHLAAAAWGAFVAVTNRVCPLTPLENHLPGPGRPRRLRGRVHRPLPGLRRVPRRPLARARRRAWGSSSSSGTRGSMASPSTAAVSARSVDDPFCSPAGRERLPPPDSRRLWHEAPRHRGPRRSRPVPRLRGLRPDGHGPRQGLRRQGPALAGAKVTLGVPGRHDPQGRGHHQQEGRVRPGGPAARPCTASPSTPKASSRSSATSG